MPEVPKENDPRDRDTDERLIIQIPSIMLWEQQKMNRLLVWAFICFAAAFVVLAAAVLYAVWFVDANDIVQRLTI